MEWRVFLSSCVWNTTEPAEKWTIACSFVQVLLRSIWHFTLPATNILQIKLFTLLFKSLGSVRFLNVFERSIFSSPTLPLFDKNTIKSVIYFCDQSWIFSIITPVFSVTWSFRNHSNMLICCSRNISDYYQCCAASCFCGNCDAFYFSGLFDD